MGARLHGIRGSTMQGGVGRLQGSSQLFGPTAPFLIDESDWASLPSGWTNPGSQDSYADGEVTIEVTAGSNYVRNIQSDAVEHWASYSWRAGTNFLLGTPDWLTQGSGFQGGANIEHLLLGVINSAGTLKFWTRYRDDSGLTDNTTSTTFVIDTQYQVVMQYVAATAPAANDGIARIWVDNILLLDVSTVDSDTLTTDALILGQNASNGLPTGDMIYDNAKMSITGVAP